LHAYVQPAHMLASTVYTDLFNGRLGDLRKVQIPLEWPNVRMCATNSLLEHLG